MTTKLPQAPATAKTPAKLLRRPVPARQPGPAYPTIEDITRRQFLIGAGSLLVLAPYGCGDSGGRTTESGAIRVEHAAGTTEVPRDVERIAALGGFADLHSLLALDVVPEIAGFIPYQKDSPLVGDRVDEVEITVDTLEPNLEKLAAANPDLIFGVDYNEEIYNELSEIAPTILLHRYDSDVNGHLRAVAKALGRPQAAEQIIAEYEDRVEEVRGAVEGTQLADMPFAVVQEYAYEGTFRVQGKSSYAGRTLQAVGIEGLIDPPEEGEPDGPDGEFGADVSTELLPEVLGPAEFIVIGTFAPFEGAQPLVDNPLWKELPAVQDGAVLEQYVDIWYHDSFLTRMARLDKIEGLAQRFG